MYTNFKMKSDKIPMWQYVLCLLFAFGMVVCSVVMVLPNKKTTAKAYDDVGIGWQFTSAPINIPLYCSMGRFDYDSGTSGSSHLDNFAFASTYATMNYVFKITDFNAPAGYRNFSVVPSNVSILSWTTPFMTMTTPTGVLPFYTGFSYGRQLPERWYLSESSSELFACDVWQSLVFSFQVEGLSVGKNAAMSTAVLYVQSYFSAVGLKKYTLKYVPYSELDGVFVHPTYTGLPLGASGYNVYTFYDNNDYYMSIGFASDNAIAIGEREYYFSSYLEYYKDTDAAYTDGYDYGYDYGYNTGYDTGKQEGLSNGLTQGYENGYSAGKGAGYQEGVQSANDYSFFSLISSVVDVPIQAFSALFDFDILGVNLKNFFLSLMTVCVILAVIKIIL